MDNFEKEGSLIISDVNICIRRDVANIISLQQKNAKKNHEPHQLRSMLAPCYRGP